MLYLTEKTKSLSKLLFDPVKHKYTLGGMVIPGVTSAIDPLLTFHASAAQLEAARKRGTRVHELTAIYDEDANGQAAALDFADDEGLSGYLQAYVQFLEDTAVQIIECELRVYSLSLSCAGTLDRILRFRGDTAPSVLDIKTGDLYAEYKLQTAAYMHCYNEKAVPSAVQQRVSRRFVLQLRSDGTYLLREHKDYPEDFAAFQAALDLLRWRLRNGK